MRRIIIAAIAAAAALGWSGAAWGACGCTGLTVTKSSGSPDVLVALNPAALKVNLGDLVPGGMIVADTGAFTDRNLKKAGFDANPFENGSLDSYQVIAVDITALTLEAVKPHGLSQKEAARCKNMWSLLFPP